jgi:hypothetical protein
VKFCEFQEEKDEEDGTVTELEAQQKDNNDEGENEETDKEIDRWEREEDEMEAAGEDEEEDAGMGEEEEEEISQEVEERQNINGDNANTTPPEEDEEVKRLVEAGNMEQLANLVLNGEGHRLIGQVSDDSDLQGFLNNVPAYMVCY